VKIFENEKVISAEPFHEIFRCLDEMSVGQDDNETVKSAAVEPAGACPMGYLVRGRTHRTEIHRALTFCGFYIDDFTVFIWPFSKKWQFASKLFLGIPFEGLPPITFCQRKSDGN
jgi:hypothetical protein